MELCRRGEGMKRRPGFPTRRPWRCCSEAMTTAPSSVWCGWWYPPERGCPSTIIEVPTWWLCRRRAPWRSVRARTPFRWRAGDAALVRREERVSLRNPNQTDAEVIVAAAPPAFLASIRAWHAAASEKPAA